MNTITANKCAHPACLCLTDPNMKDDNKYCSQSCKESASLTEIACQCGHAVCAK
jgi:hypothetical protein